MKVKTSPIKEYFYIGTYETAEGVKVIKLGTTNNLIRREREHKKGIPLLKTSPGDNFRIIWHIKLSQANTLRAENEMREELKKE